MAITVNSAAVVRDRLEGDWWFVSVYSADLSGCEELKAAVTGKSHYIRKIQILAQSVTDITFTIGAGETSDAVTTAYLGPIPLPDAGGGAIFDFGPDHVLKIAVSSALTIDASAACPTMVLVWGKTAT
jgi:hypothetical protein